VITKSIHCLSITVCLCIDRKELGPELLFEGQPRLKRENASVCLLVEEVFGPFCYISALEKCQGPEDLLLVQVKLLWSQLHIEGTRIQEHLTVILLSIKVW